MAIHTPENTAASRSAREAVDNIREATTQASIPVERLTASYWDPFSSRHGPGALHPDAIPVPFRAPAVHQSHSENSQVATNPINRGSSPINSDLLTPPGLTSNGSASSPESHGNVNNVPPTPKLTQISPTNKPVAYKTLKIVPKQARPDPDLAKCLRFPWHDPFIGGGCEYGYGERTKPFPFLHGRPIAEEPPSRLVDAVCESWRRGSLGRDAGSILRRNASGAAASQTSGSSEAASKDTSVGKAALIQSLIGDTPSADDVPEYATCNDIPSSAALARPDNEAEARDLNPNVGPFGYGINNHSFRVASMHSKIKRSDVKDMAMWQLDPRSGEPGPRLDLRPLFNVVADGEQMPRPFKELMYDLRGHIHRYFQAWDVLLKVLHENLDLEAEREHLRKEAYELSVNATNNRAKKRAQNLQLRQQQHIKESRKMYERYKTCQAEATSSTKTLYVFKMKVARVLADPGTAYRRWAEGQKAMSGRVQSSTGSQSVGSSNISGGKRARENDDQVQGNVGPKRTRLSN